MKAAIYQGNQTFSSGVSEPVAPGPGEVRLHVACCGVCGTDVHIYHGAMDGRVGPPQIIGHEASAEIAEIGEGVEGLSLGDRVAVRPDENCVVIGGGPIGLLIGLVAREKDAKVLMAEANPARLSLAADLGLDTVNPLEKDLPKEMAACPPSR